MFTLDAPSGLDVSVVGSFNDWEPQAMTQGTYEYRFLVDADWREDPNNPRKTPNKCGGYDSICDVL
jgi:1,4-alpha-glucan branching enzyme